MKRQIGISLPAHVQEAVERWRMSQPIPPSKSAAMAALIAEGLKVFEARYGVQPDMFDAQAAVKASDHGR